MPGGCQPMSCVCCNYAAPMRHVIAFLLLFGVIVAYCHRVCLSIAITEMVQPVKRGKAEMACPIKKNASKVSDKTKLKWSEKDQGNILMSFYIGYAGFHLPMGYIMNSPCAGARWVFAIGMIVSTITTAILPIVIKKLGLEALIVLRCITGIGQASVFMSIAQLMSRWIPPEKRAQVGGMVFAGNSLGSILGISITGILVHSMGQWEFVYYLWGALSAFWCVLYIMYVYSDPLQHPRITDDEKEYLVEVIPVGHHSKCPPIKLMLSDPAVWAIILIQFSNNYTLYLLITSLPKYLKDLLHVDVDDNAYLSSVPHVAQYIGGVMSGFFADYLIKKKNCNRLMLRKIYAVVCILFPSICLLLFGPCKCDSLCVMGFAIAALFFKGFFYSGPKVNTLDISVNHAGFMMAMQNGLGSICGAISPYFISFFTTEASIFTAISQLMSRWIPPEERAKIGGLVYAGNSVGSIIGIAVTGFIVEFMGEWEAIYYVWSLVAVVWCVLFFMFVYSDPLFHPFVTPAEKEYLIQAIAASKRPKCPPIGRMLADPAVWGLGLIQFSNNYILFFMITNIPKYMKDLLHTDLKSNAIMSSVPHAAQYVGGILSGILADYLIKKKNFNVLFLRRLYAVICITIPAAFLILLGLCRCNEFMATGCFLGGLFFKGFFYSGPKVNSLDLTVNHAGFLMAIQNGIGAFSGFISPAVVAALTKEQTFKNWDMVWYVTFAVTNILTIVYLVTASGDRALWDYPPEERAGIKAARKEAKQNKDKPKIKWYKQRTEEEFVVWAAAQKAIIDARNARTKEERQRHIEEDAKLKADKKAAKEAKAAAAKA